VSPAPETAKGRDPSRTPLHRSRRRRPSGEPPPLPRPLGPTGHLLLGLTLTLGAIVLLVLGHETAGAWFDRGNASIARAITAVRTGWLTSFALDIDRLLASRATVGILRLGASWR
jgi:hypothetical protein